MKKVLFVTYGSLHANIVKLVSPRFSEEFEVEILALTVADRDLNKSGISHNTIKDYLNVFSIEEQQKILQYGNRFAYCDYNPDSEMKYIDSVVYTGIGCLSNEMEKTEEAAISAYMEKGRESFFPVWAMTKILEYVNPDIVITTTWVRSEGATSVAANKLNIPNVMIVAHPTLCEIPYLAHLCVLNDFAEKYMIENNIISKEYVHVTGQPVYENSLKVDKNILANVRNDINFESYKNMVLYLEQPMCKDTDEIEQYLRKASEEKKDTLFVLKLHPTQELPEEIIDGNYVKTRGMDLKSLLYLTTVAITKDSSTAIEAALHNKDVIQIGIQENLLYDFSNYGIAVVTHDIESLDQYIEKMRKTGVVADDLSYGRKMFMNKENSIENIYNVAMSLL